MTPGITKEQLREAEEGLVRLLFAKRFKREWIERHVPEVMAQAASDLAVRMAAGREDETVGLLVVIGYRRALKVLRSQTTGPPIVSTEEVFHLIDEKGKTPEEEVLDFDRQARLLKALSRLPDREQKLMALIYIGDMTVKDAGRRLGWSPSSAVRHQREALAKLRELVGDRDLLGAEIAVPAFVASGCTLPAHRVGPWLEAAANSIRELFGVAAHRYAPMAEAGNAMAMSGASRTTAGVCGLAVAACITAVTSGVVGPGLGALNSANPSDRGRQEERPAEQSRTSRAPIVTPGSYADLYGTGVKQPGGHRVPGVNGPKSDRDSKRRRWAERQPAARKAPQSSAAQTSTEFGVEGGDEEAQVVTPQTSPIGPAAPAPPPPSESTSSGSGSSSAGSEFGM